MQRQAECREGLSLAKDISRSSHNTTSRIRNFHPSILTTLNRACLKNILIESILKLQERAQCQGNAGGTNTYLSFKGKNKGNNLSAAFLERKRVLVINYSSATKIS